MKKITVAIIGAGLIGKKRADALKRIPEYSLKTVFDVNEKAMNEFAEMYHCETASNVEAIINDPMVDMVILAIAHKPAAEIAPKIVSLKHLLIEKPLGRNSHEAKAIITAAKKSSKQLFVGFNYVYYPHIKKTFAELKKGTIGKLISSTFRIGHAAEPGYEKSWKMSKDMCGGGVIIDPGIHFLHLLISEIGYPEHFMATALNLGWNTEVEDEAVIVFQLKDKMISTHHYSLNMSHNTLFIELVGTKGVIRATGRSGNYGLMKYSFVPRWHWKNQEPIVYEEFDNKDDSFFMELQDIVTKLNMKRDYNDYIDTMKLLDSLYA